MNTTFHGLSVGLPDLARLSDAQSRSITAENPTGERGGGARAEVTGERHPARELGRGWKVAPSIFIQPGETFTVAQIAGPGAIQHIWMAPNGNWRDAILRFYWDEAETPAIECPIGDFFACGWGFDAFSALSSLAVCVNPGSGLNCYWPMPFRCSCRITLENRAPVVQNLYYQIDYALGEVPADCAYFCAQFRRTNPLPYGEVFTILDGVRGRGHYVGTAMCWGVNNAGWWGEGEIKFYLDGDVDPTICGTGTEDYFCGAYNFENRATKQYQKFCTPYAGMSHLLRPDGVYRSQTRFGLYRWHIPDPIRFREDLRVTIQALGWRSEGRFLPLQDDIASVAFWYQSLPIAPFPVLPGRDALEII